MAVAHDAATESATFTTTDPFTFDHVPVGTPAGAAVFICVFGAAETITAVTYGGTAMTFVVDAVDTATELGTVYAYFLGSPASGTQTVSIDHAASATIKAAYAVTVTAGTSTTAVNTSAEDNENQADPSAALATTNSALRYGFIYSGLPNVTDLAVLTGMTAVHDLDTGARVLRLDRETTASTSFTIGWTAVTDDVAAVYIAIEEVSVAALAMSVGAVNIGF